MKRIAPGRAGFPDPVTGPWTLEALRSKKVGAPKHGLKVFSCFHCGGGSTMGYKLAGFDVLGGVEIDPQMMQIYKSNHSPKHSFLMGVQDFKDIPNGELPEELFSLDVLDGSPPCSSFSTSGARDKDWGKDKKFREGQQMQRLDDLFFHFIDVAKKLQPKVVVAENVKGLIIGKAKGYVKEIFRDFDKAGYDCQLFLLNASLMGVPQMRERTFFLARRKDLKLPKFELSFSERPITVGQAIKGTSSNGAKPLTGVGLFWWAKVQPGKRIADVHPEKHMWDWRKTSPNVVSHTITASIMPMHWAEKRFLSPEEIVRLQSFPDDFDFMDADAGYICGMSVPPLMMQRVALEVARALLSNGLA